MRWITSSTPRLKLIILFLTLLFCSCCWSYESVDAIKSVARNFIMKNMEVNPGETIEVQINRSSFQVHACGKEIEASFPINASREQISSLELSCHDENPWRIFVPVEVQVFSKVLVAKRTIPAREMITEEDIDFTLANKNRLYSGYFSNKEEVVGDVALHLIPAGTVLTNKNLQLPVLVHKNQTISIVAVSNAVVVTMQGIAKADGALNASIKVMNPSSKQLLDAVVIGPNKAQIVS